MAEETRGMYIERWLEIETFVQSSRKKLHFKMTFNLFLSSSLQKILLLWSIILMFPPLRDFRESLADLNWIEWINFRKHQDIVFFNFLNANNFNDISNQSIQSIIWALKWTTCKLEVISGLLYASFLQMKWLAKWSAFIFKYINWVKY